MMAARTEHEWCATREVCDRGGERTIPCQRRTREGQRRRTQMADGFVLPLRPGKATPNNNRIAVRDVRLGGSGRQDSGSRRTLVSRDAIRYRWDMVGSKLDERGRRMFAAGEGRTAGRG